MHTIIKTVVYGPVGPAERAGGYTYVHDSSLDGDEDLVVGKRVEVCNDAGEYFAATVSSYEDHLWELRLVP